MEHELTSLIQGKAIVLYKDASAEQAARAMCANAVGSVVVFDRRGHLVGMLTDRDLTCRLVADGMDSSAPIFKFMTSQPVYATKEMDIRAVIRLMEENGIRRIPVIETTHAGRHHCEGIVTLDDLIAVEAIEPSGMKRIIRSQILRRIRAAGLHRARDTHFGDLVGAVRLATALDEEFARSALRSVLDDLARRMHYTGALRFISVLPKTLQDELLELAPGPDRAINASRMIRNVSLELGISEPEAHETVSKVCGVVDEWIGGRLMIYVRAQLPADIRALFPEEEFFLGEAA